MKRDAFEAYVTLGEALGSKGFGDLVSEIQMMDPECCAKNSKALRNLIKLNLEGYALPEDMRHTKARNEIDKNPEDYEFSIPAAFEVNRHNETAILITPNKQFEGGFDL